IKIVRAVKWLRLTILEKRRHISSTVNNRNYLDRIGSPAVSNNIRSHTPKLEITIKQVFPEVPYSRRLRNLTHAVANSRKHGHRALHARLERDVFENRVEIALRLFSKPIVRHSIVTELQV